MTFSATADNSATAPGASARVWGENIAIRTLRAGGIIVHATEGVFGIAGRAFDRSACAAVAALKFRSRNKPFIVVAADFAQVAALADATAVGFDPARAGWPGPETWILPVSRTAPRWLYGSARTIAVRVTAHPQFIRLCRAVGPVVSTSANPQGRSPALNLLDARRYFGAAIGFYLPGELLTPGRPSRIRDGRSGRSLRS